MVEEARGDTPDAEWKKYPSLGMQMHGTSRKANGEALVCFTSDDTSPHLFRLQPKDGGFFIAAITRTSSCK